MNIYKNSMAPCLLSNKKKKINDCYVLFLEMYSIIKIGKILCVFLIFVFNWSVFLGILHPNR